MKSGVVHQKFKLLIIAGVAFGIPVQASLCGKLFPRALSAARIYEAFLRDPLTVKLSERDYVRLQEAESCDKLNVSFNLTAREGVAFPETWETFHQEVQGLFVRGSTIGWNIDSRTWKVWFTADKREIQVVLSHPWVTHAELFEREH